MRVRKKKWADGELTSNQFICKEPNHKGNWSQVFKNNHPIMIEIGCGKGNFITQNAVSNPDVNYIAIEREPLVIVNGARKARELEDMGNSLDNIVFVIGDAKNLLDLFDENEISRIYLNFSDPWPSRKKWAKRRLTYRKFLDMYAHILVPKGEIHLKTDNTNLFEFSLNEFSNENWTMKNISLDLHNSDFEGNIMTEYEMKFSAKGMPIYRLEAYKKECN